jgi:hypothetical protein
MVSSGEQKMFSGRLFFSLKQSTMIKKYLLLLVLVAGAANLKSAAPDWQINASSYEFSMLVTSVARIDGVELKHPGDRIAAFSGGQLCGVASPVFIEAIDRNIFYLMVMSNSTSTTENISFKIYDATADRVVDALNTILFERNKATGSAQLPWIISNVEQKNGVELQLSGFVENLPHGTMIASLLTWNNGKTVTAVYDLPTGIADNALFAVTGNNLTTNADFNYESKQFYRVQIRSVSQDSGTQTAYFDLALTDVNEAPVSISLSRDTVSENAVAGTLVGKLTAIDEDAEEVFTYQLVPASAHFRIEGDKLLTSVQFNFEEQTSYPVNVQVTDKAGNKLSRAFTIMIKDENDAPSELTLLGDTLFCNLPAGIIAGIVSATDEDKQDVISYYLIAGAADNNLFSLNPVTGVLKTSATIPGERAGELIVRVMADDGKGGQTQTNLPVIALDHGFRLIANEIRVSFAYADTSTMVRYWHGKEVNVKVSVIDQFATVRFECGEEIQSYNIYNTAGSLISSGEPRNTNFVLKMNTFPKGIYYIRMKTAGGMVSEKMTVY